MATVIGARLLNDGTLFTAGTDILDDGFDEVTISTHRVTPTSILADEFDEVTLSAGQPSGGSILFNGTTQYLTVPGSSDYVFGNDPFTIEGWFFTTATTYQRLWSFSDGDNVEIMGSTVYYWNGTALNNSGPNVIQVNQWKHIALVKTVTVGVNSGNPVVTVYVNGTSVITDNSPFNSTNSRPLAIGGEIADSVTGEDATPSARDGFFTGNISNFRIVKGIAVYTANFSTPIAPFSATQNSSVHISAIPATYTKLLLKVVDSGHLLTDSSQYAKSLTGVNGPTFSALTSLSTAYNGKMKQQKSGELLVAYEFDEYTGI
jgi:hypothetical protein